MTVAEGVETQEQAEWLRGQGVHFLQGYWISRPLSLAGLVAAHDEPANYLHNALSLTYDAGTDVGHGGRPLTRVFCRLCYARLFLILLALFRPGR